MVYDKPNFNNIYNKGNFFQQELRQINNLVMYLLT